jgi:hypothetical protein
MSIHDLEARYGDPLISRESGGIYVAMFYDPESNSDDVRIFYDDSKEGISFVLNPPKFLAPDAFQHPIMYANAELRGISNPRRLVPCELAAA